jgi:hypothetical protein
MLIDQIKLLSNTTPGIIEKIIYEIQALAANGWHSWTKSVFSNEEEIIKYFTDEGFSVNWDEDSGVMTIYWLS